MTREGAAAGTAPGGSGPTSVKDLEDLLVTLRRSSRDLAFYPPKHPLLKNSMENAVSLLRAVLGARAPLAITVSRASFSFEGLPVGQENRQLGAMAGELFVRRIQQIQFGEGVGMEELAAFLRMIASDPKHLLEQGGPAKALAALGGQRIQVTEMEFRHLSEAKGPAGRTAGAADQGRGKEGGPEAGSQEGTDAGTSGEAIGATAAAGVAAGQKPSAAEALLSAMAPKGEETVEALIRRLEREAASGKPAGYEWTAGRLETAAGRAVRDDRLKDVVASLRVFLRHQRADNLGEPLRERAARAVETIAAGSTVPYLVEHLRSEADASAEDLVAVLVGLEGRVIPPLLALLATGGQAVARERLVAILAGLSEVAQRELSRALPEADRDQACRLVPILGEIGGEAGVALLASLFRHRDVRVRRETVRELGRIEGTSAHRLLLQALRDPDPAVLELAIGLVGAARVKLAIPGLLRLAGQRVLSGRPFAVRKAAVTALGAMGDPGSIAMLVRILRTRTWFKRAAGDQLRLAAAQALLSMLRPEAREVVEAGARSRRGDVRRACNAALRKLGAPALTKG
jgi:HEAT repeat protein